MQKYGGTSVTGPERIRAVARRIAAARAAGHAMVVVVSVTLLVSLSIYGSNGNFNLSG